ncbi:MAG: hypothetical protein H6502_01165 [Candidatus Woesearchaeota archaeon]|nr:MAG: hypothetical protein H6502_01165 [Candidatus Woesearchaeota archaeon]
MFPILLLLVAILLFVSLLYLFVAFWNRRQVSPVWVVFFAALNFVVIVWYVLTYTEYYVRFFSKGVFMVYAVLFASLAAGFLLLLGLYRKLETERIALSKLVRELALSGAVSSEKLKRVVSPRKPPKKR